VCVNGNSFHCLFFRQFAFVYLRKSCKRECWRNFTTSINSSLHPTQLWTQIRKISNKRGLEHITAIRNNQGEIQNEPQHIANILANYLHTMYQGNPLPATLTEGENSINDSPQDEPNLEELNKPITMEELKEAISILAVRLRALTLFTQK